MNDEDRGAGTRFLSGMWIGSLAGTVVVALIAATVGWLLVPIPVEIRTIAAAAAVLIFAIADFADRTPQMGRQVPQRFIRVLNPGMRGLWWGADLSLIYTTRKTTSLLWALLVALVLVVPPVGVVASLLLANAIFVLGVTVQTKQRKLALLETALGRVNIDPTVRRIRILSGLVLLVAVVLLILAVLW